MHIEVAEIVENGDGSATLHLDMDAEATETLLSFAVVQAIKNGLDAHEKEIEDSINSSQLELEL